MPYCIRLMRQENIDQVSEIDREAFPTMLPPANFQRELDSPLAHYIVACAEEGGSISSGARKGKYGRRYVIGFAGFWLMAGEAHIVNIAVRQSCQRGGAGELLLISLIDLAVGMEASLITLEVRASNTIARGLYERYGFSDRGLRKKYYSDNGEDAVIMTVDNISSPLYRMKLDKLKKEHSDRWGKSTCQIAC